MSASTENATVPVSLEVCLEAFVAASNGAAVIERLSLLLERHRANFRAEFSEMGYDEDQINEMLAEVEEPSG